MPILGKREPSALQQTLPVTVLYLHTSPVRDAFSMTSGKVMERVGPSSIDLWHIGKGSRCHIVWNQ